MKTTYAVNLFATNLRQMIADRTTIGRKELEALIDNAQIKTLSAIVESLSPDSLSKEAKDKGGD